jgi:hypothetical protein
MRVAVVLDTPFDGWDPPGHERRMTTEVAAWEHDGANTNPFSSYGHDMANAADQAGMDYYQLVYRLVDEAVARDGDA